MVGSGIFQEYIKIKLGIKISLELQHEKFLDFLSLSNKKNPQSMFLQLEEMTRNLMLLAKGWKIFHLNKITDKSVSWFKVSNNKEFAFKRN